MLTLNDKAFFYFKNWHIPEVEGVDNSKDRWLILPANLIVGNGRFHVSTLDTRAATHSLMVVRNDGMIVSVKRGRAGIQITNKMLGQLQAEAIDIIEWEAVMGQQWDYNLMFDTALVEERFTSRWGNDRAKYYMAPHDSPVFNNIFATAKVQPCRSCGKKR